MKKLKDIGELGLIERFKKRYKTFRHTIVGIGDDTAVIRPLEKGKFILLTNDTLVENIHFIRNEANGYKIGWKALGVCLSDIAAMGGRPLSAVISLALPPDLEINFIDGFIKGIIRLAELFKVDIVGGDTVNSQKAIVITVTAIGEVSKNKMALRSGARAGDKILVTGNLGGSIYGKQFSFIPRIKEAQWLVNNAKINSMMDISDGLSLDLYRIIKESKKGAIIYKKSIPISLDAYKTEDPLKSAMNDGEDFELLFTTKDTKKILEKWPYKKISISVIGEITGKEGKIFIKDKNDKMKILCPEGYEHFKVSEFEKFRYLKIKRGILKGEKEFSSLSLRCFLGKEGGDSEAQCGGNHRFPPLSILSNSPEKTKKIGEKLGKKLKKGDIIALIGELGSGKTCLTQGLMKGLKVSSKKVTSPTFVLLNIHKGRLPVYHFDMYRIKNIREVEDIGYEEYLYNDGVTIIEWADKIRKLLPRKCIKIKLKIKGENRREIKIEGVRLHENSGY